MKLLHWKDEGGDAGPLVLVDDDALARWRRDEGLAPDSVGVPYGSKPGGVEQFGWTSLAQARRVARARAVPLVDDIGAPIDVTARDDAFERVAQDIREHAGLIESAPPDVLIDFVWGGDALRALEVIAHDAHLQSISSNQLKADALWALHRRVSDYGLGNEFHEDGPASTTHNGAPGARRKERGAMATATSEAPTATGGAETYVKDALRKAGGPKYADLDDEQRARADGAHLAEGGRSGLRGKDLVTWIVTGQTEGERDRAEGMSGTSRAKASTPKARKGSPYSDEVRSAVKLAAALRGGSHGAGPKQHQRTRDVVIAIVKEEDGGAEVTPAHILKLSGAPSMEKLRDIATGDAPRADVALLRDLSKRTGAEDLWCRGRYLAGQLYVWAEQLRKAAAE